MHYHNFISIIKTIFKVASEFSLKLGGKLNIEIGLSTLNSGIYKINFNKAFKYIVIHQISDEGDYSDIISTLPENVRYISSHELGLSKSRNLAIENSKAEYLWIMDDDVEINDNAIQYIEDLITKNSESTLIVVSHSLGGIETREVKEKTKKINVVSATRICSIDMIVKISDLGMIRFNTEFGLGAKYPSGEEYIFACNLINAGKTVIKSNRICSIHPEMQADSIIYPGKNDLSTKKRMFIIANGKIIGSLLYVAFVLKKIIKL